MVCAHAVASTPRTPTSARSDDSNPGDPGRHHLAQPPIVGPPNYTTPDDQSSQQQLFLISDPPMGGRDGGAPIHDKCLLVRENGTYLTHQILNRKVLFRYARLGTASNVSL